MTPVAARNSRPPEMKRESFASKFMADSGDTRPENQVQRPTVDLDQNAPRANEG